jgi:hypothetical protein
MLPLFEHIFLNKTIILLLFGFVGVCVPGGGEKGRFKILTVFNG